jgi:hypothetical protein
VMEVVKRAVVGYKVMEVRDVRVQCLPSQKPTRLGLVLARRARFCIEQMREVRWMWGTRWRW